MVRAYLNFLRGVSASWIGRLGVALTTATFLLLILFEGLSLAGVLRNAYLGLLTYLTLPALFVAGLLLIPVGWWIQLRRTGRSTRELLAERFAPVDLRAGAVGSRVFLILAALTTVNLLFLGGASSQMVHFMDQPSFCGTACHVMQPEWTAYQASPHARVDCVECHVGEGVAALVQSKISGLRQTIAFARGTYERPIPTPVHPLRPARETCETCHWVDGPERSKIVQTVRYARDAASTPRYTTLSLELGTAAGTGRGIHWHASGRSRIRYGSIDGQREQIRWVEVTGADGATRRFERRAPGALAPVASARPSPTESVREMDCLDCHNRVAHVYEDADEAIDQRIDAGQLTRDLPFMKERAVAAVTGRFPDAESAMRGIRADITGYYRRAHPSLSIARAREIERAVDTLQDVWRRNVHPAMRVEFGTYPDHAGHPARGRGCFRCHDREMVDERGVAVRYDCTLCHSILAEESDGPFSFIEGDVVPADELRAEWLREDYLAGRP